MELLYIIGAIVAYVLFINIKDVVWDKPRREAEKRITQIDKEKETLKNEIPDKNIPSSF